MNSSKKFAKNYPLLIAALTTVFVFVMLKISHLIPDGPLAPGISETFVAVVVIAWTFLFMGKEKFSFNLKGFGYAFRVLRAYYIFMAVYVLISIISLVVTKETPSDMPVNLLNAIIMGCTVGIVEEFTFRGLVFGGILQKVGNSKNGIIAAAVISGLIFGVMHVVGAMLSGEITSLDTILTALLKTCQTGIFGIIMALIYLKTRNILAVAALHGLDDFIIFVMSACSRQETMGPDSYVSGQIGLKVFSYIIFTLIMVPMLIKCIKDIKENEAIPFDDDFKPRMVKYEKSRKKNVKK